MTDSRCNGFARWGTSCVAILWLLNSASVLVADDPTFAAAQQLALRIDELISLRWQADGVTPCAAGGRRGVHAPRVSGHLRKNPGSG